MSASWSTTIWGRNKRKFCQRLECMLFMMALSVSSNFNCFWQWSMFKIFSEERTWRKERKRGFTFAHFLFTATPRHKSLARKKKFQGLDNGLDWTFSLNGTFDDFFNFFFFMAAVCSGTMYTWEGKLIQIVVALC